MKPYVPIAALMLLAGVKATAQQPGEDAGGFLSAAEAVGDINGLTPEDYLSLQLPPLGVLLENARKNPVVEYFAARKDEELRVLKSVRRNWWNYIKISGSYTYGVTNYYEAYYDPAYPVVRPVSDNSKGLWNVGASVSLPLYEIIDRRNQIRRQKSRIVQAEMEIDRWQDEQDLKIIEAYTTAVQNLSLLKTMAEAVTLADAQYEVSEADFVNGKIDAQTLSRQKNIQSQIRTTYEQTRGALNSALLRLEVLSKTKIINR